MSGRAPLVLIPQFFGSLVFDRRTSRYLPFDAAATDLLLALADGPIERVLAEAAGADHREQIIRFFEHFYELGFFTVDTRFAGTVLEGVDVPADHLVGPLAVHLEVVAACNLMCTHCFAGDLPRHENRLSLAELDRLFAEMARLGSFRLGLTGGEPLLRKDIFQIIDLALGHGLAPCITTNGLLITDELAREFGRRKLAWLNVSLEGATAVSNDRVRGEGTFGKVLDRLAVLRRHARFTLAFTIMSTNVDEVRACAELADEVGADTAVFRPLYPVGVAMRHPELMPSFADYNTALDSLAGMADEGLLSLRHIDPFSPHARRETQFGRASELRLRRRKPGLLDLCVRRGQPVQLPGTRVRHGKRTRQLAGRDLAHQRRIPGHQGAAALRTRRRARQHRHLRRRLPGPRSQAERLGQRTGPLDYRPGGDGEARAGPQPPRHRRRDRPVPLRQPETERIAHGILVRLAARGR